MNKLALIYQISGISTNLLSLLLWLGSLIANVIGWWFVASRVKGKETVERIERLEKYNKRVIGWVFGKFGVDLNGDS